MSANETRTPLLQAVALSKQFTVGHAWSNAGRRIVHAVDDVSFAVFAG